MQNKALQNSLDNSETHNSENKYNHETPAWV